MAERDTTSLPPPRPDDEPAPEEFDDDAYEPTPRRGPGPMMRFLVVAFGVMLLGIGRAAFEVGGVFGVAIGIVMDVLAVVIIAIAIGVVEWFVKRRRART